HSLSSTTRLSPLQPRQRGFVHFPFPHDDDHRRFHSFPTRRSSDLRCRCQSVACCSAWPAFSRRPSSNHGASNCRPTGKPLSKPRSEEHTSELQSRFDLVCRLLLEKKKKQDIHTTSQCSSGC